MPSISATVFKGASDEEITNKVIEPSRIQLLILLLAASGFILLGREFVILWVGPGYDEVYLLSCILLITSILNLSQNTITSVLKAKNMLHGKSLILAASTACNFVITLLLVPKMGALGAVIGSAFSLLFGYGLALNIYYHRVIHINMFTYYKKTYSGIVPATLLAMLVGWGITRLIPLGGWLGFLLKGCCYVSVFALLMYLLGINEDEKRMIAQFFRRFKKKQA